jgi:hypothetical protein
MKIVVSIFTLTLFALLSVFAIDSATGQTKASTSAYRKPAANANQAPATQTAASTRIVGYRATDWKSVHSHSAADAEQMLATFKKIGCEVDTENHGDHVDVKFRCPEWRSMKLTSVALQAQWSTWCENQGMETVVVNPPANTQRPTVKFRMPAAKTVHMHDAEKAKQILNTLSLVGCKVDTRDHDGHIDATFDCPEWKTIELVSEDSAHAWEKWLKESGFETKNTQVQTPAK